MALIFPLDTLAIFAGGLILLLAGAHYLIPGTMGLARRLSLPPALVATIIIAGGTSAPELIVSVEAAILDKPHLIWGNVVGSNITNILLVLGLGALVSPLQLTDPHIKRDATIMLALTAILLFCGWVLGTLPVWMAALFILFVGIYIWQAIRHGHAGTEDEGADTVPLRTAFVMAVGGLAGLLTGANLMVHAAAALATEAGISEAVVGLTIIAIGTSLPEIAAAIASMMKRRADVALGNVLGSNIFNIAAVMGGAGLFGPLAAPADLNGLAFLTLTGATALLSVMIWRDYRLGRRWAFVFISFFSYYMIAAIY